jgi:hypothetical protein
MSCGLATPHSGQAQTFTPPDAPDREGDEVPNRGGGMSRAAGSSRRGI